MSSFANQDQVLLNNEHGKAYGDQLLFLLENWNFLKLNIPIGRGLKIPLKIDFDSIGSLLTLLFRKANIWKNVKCVWQELGTSWDCIWWRNMHRPFLVSLFWWYQWYRKLLSRDYCMMFHFEHVPPFFVPLSENSHQSQVARSHPGGPKAPNSRNERLCSNRKLHIFGCSLS